MYSHILIIGGTGMLREASTELASQTQCLTSVAHTRESLAALDSTILKRSGKHHMLALDWSEPDAFIGAIMRHIASTEQPDFVLAWTHNAGLAIRLASMLVTRPVQFFHVVGSAATNPARVAAQTSGTLQPSAGVDYHQIILGKKGQGNASRWLTDKEISSGVLEAIREKRGRFVVGTLENW